MTAYDPSDLPGTSIDPLGFERGYLFLADKILPGLTNVASHPRYFALLCAGIYLNGDTTGITQRDLVRKRQEIILRLERFWALANVLALPDQSNAIRGVTYAQAQADELRRSGATRTSAKYPLLSRQVQYGVIGIYANVGAGMRFLNREDLTLTPALGEKAAEAFIGETELPGSVRRAVLDDGDVPLATLKAWGERAHVDGEVKAVEAACLFEALHCNATRSRMAGFLKRHPWTNVQDTELCRLARIRGYLKSKDEFQDLREAISCILEFESCYQVAALMLERLLWVCRHHAAASVTLAELNGDPVVQCVRDVFPARVRRFLSTLDSASNQVFRANLDRLSDVREFLEKAQTAVDDIDAFLTAFIVRHTEVQHGKFDRGRRKMPWLERTDTGVNLTMTRAGGASRELRSPDDFAPHPYRLGAADALVLGAGRAPQA
ncbi:MAG: hypothetical protein IT165_03815 [Bryobacterales bacterium]|nr:hypothetical protein [Bryobacterales bacterium]